MRDRLVLLCFAGLLLGATCAHAIPALKSLSVQLPQSDANFPSGPGVDAANGNCLGCHSVEMVMNQPSLPRATWAKEVDKMRHVYKAPISDADASTVVNYLSAIKGAKN
jgi:hypothetical protein